MGLLAVVTLGLACADAPSEPSWDRDVIPLLAANCIRCHGAPAIGGAPDGFRLDVWEDTVDDSGRRILGAGSMADFSAARAEAGQMPPRFELRGRQMDLLRNWVDLRDDTGLAPPPGEPSADNRAPTARLIAGFEASGDGARVTLELIDADGDVLSGELALRQGSSTTIVARNLRGGRQTVELDPFVFTAGDYRFIVFVRDHPLRTVEVSLGPVTIDAVDGNTAPRVRLVEPSPAGTLYTDADTAATAVVELGDPDLGDLHTVTLTAVRGITREVLVEDAPILVGETPVVFDPTVLPAGSGWVLEATVSDGTVTRTARVGKVSIAHGTTSLRWDDVEDLFDDNCEPCHRGAGDDSRIPGLAYDFKSYEDEGSSLGVFGARGRIYQRVVVEANMPAASGRVLYDDDIGLSAEERALIGEWLAGGAPQ